MTSQWMDVRVQERRLAARDILYLGLETLDGSPLPGFEAGAHIDLELPNRLVRQYSLCGSPSQTARYDLGILLEPDGRGGSRSAHEDIREGDVVRISSPRNLFALGPSKHSILLAGGIGITPIMSMAAALDAGGKSFELHYCARSADRAAFLDRLTTSPFSGRVRCHLDDQPDTLLDFGSLFASASADAHVYICGPGGFIDHVVSNARAAGWDENRIHLERFTASPVDHDGDGEFQIQIAGSGRTISVRADQTVAEALAAAGIDIPLSCEQGICGTCLLQVLDGVPDHRDMYLSDEEHAANDCFTPCCSRALTPQLVIQL